MQPKTDSSKRRSTLASIFLSPVEPRLRAGWRLLIQTVGMLVIELCIGGPLLIIGLLVGWGGTGSLLLSAAIELFAVTISVFLARRLLDRRPIASLGLQISWKMPMDLTAGIVIAFFQIGLIYLALRIPGWVKFEGFAWQSEGLPWVMFNTLLMLIQFIIIGWSEELLSRGYHLQTIASGLDRAGQGMSGWPLAIGVILSSAIFGVLHLANPNATWVSAIGILFAGLFLALPFILTKQLWLSIGLHIGWNFFEGVVFGFPVSGINVFALTHITVTGPDLWTGGPFGPEAGLVVIPALGFGLLLIYAYIFLRKQFIKSSHP